MLYIGVTNSLTGRLSEHRQDAEGPKKTFAGKYNCYNLVHAEWYQYIDKAIEREKEIKKWTRARKEALIASENPDWKFLETDMLQ